MPSPESSRRNLEHARRVGRVIFWRSPSESQRVKAEIVLLHHTKAGLSQRAIARMLHVSQPYVARLLKRVRVLGIEKALGEAYERYRAGMEVKRRDHFLAVGGPASLIAETPEWNRAFNWAIQEPQPPAPMSWATPAATKVKAEETAEAEYIELARSTSGEVIEIHGSKPARTAPTYTRPSRALTTKEIAAMGRGLFVADQCRSFGRR